MNYDCPICRDSGVVQDAIQNTYVWCSCQAGEQIRFGMPEWLETLNQVIDRSRGCRLRKKGPCTTAEFEARVRS